MTEDFVNPSIAKRVVDLRVMTEKCLRNCFHCFTEKAKKTLSLEDIKQLLDQLAEMQVKAVDFLGEGEPTLDKDFFEIMEYTKSKGIQPVIFTDAATKLRDLSFVRRLKDIGATVIPKCDSLRNAEYQNRVVDDKTGTYFDQRNEALQLLIQE
ncbi:MAG: radical SAM protein [bacterium]